MGREGGGEKGKGGEDSFFFVYSLLACDLPDHGEIMYSPFPVCCPRSGGPLQAPLCPPPRPILRRCGSHQGDYTRKERKASVEDKGKNIGKNTAPHLSRSCGCHEVGRGKEQRGPGSSTGSSTSLSPSTPPPTGSSAGSSTPGTP